jgi:hypothetical protein
MKDALAHGHIRGIGAIDPDAEAAAVRTLVVIAGAALCTLAADVGGCFAYYPVSGLEALDVGPDFGNNARKLANEIRW